MGFVDADGFLSIVDRKKELIINAAGKNMYPTNIENTITASCPLVGSVAVIGDARPFNIALISLDLDALATAAAKPGVESCSPADLVDDQVVRDAVRVGIDTANAKLSRPEQIKGYEVVRETWMPGGDFLTPTNKLKRAAIGKKYANVVEQLYATANRSHGKVG